MESQSAVKQPRKRKAAGIALEDAIAAIEDLAKNKLMELGGFQGLNEQEMQERMEKMWNLLHSISTEVTKLHSHPVVAADKEKQAKKAAK